MRFFPQWFLLFLAGCLSGFAFAPFYQVWVLLITLGFLFHALNQEISPRRAACHGFCFGFGVGLASMSWLSNALLIDGGRFAWAIPFALAGMGVVFGAFTGCAAFAAGFAQRGCRRLCAWAAAVVVFEWIRSWIFTGLPWNLWGSAWGFCLPLLQSASVWGVYGLSLVTILTASAAAFLPRKKPLVLAACGLALLYVLGSARLYRASDTVVWGVQLRVVQPNIPQSLKWDPEQAEASFAKLMRLSRVENAAVTHVIWPESAVPFIINHHDAERLLLMGAVRQGGTLITGGLRAVNPEQRLLANSIFIVDDLADVRGYYDKSHLVPFGEYVPLRGILPLEKLVPIAADFQAGDGLRTLAVPKAPPAGLLVCYEVIFSGRVVEKARRPSWLVNVTNDGWYGLSAGPHQHLGMARLRAVEEGLPLVRAANTGISAVFDPYGRTAAMLPLGEEGVLDSRLPAALQPTLYARGGVWIPLVLCGLLLAFSLRCRK